MTPKQAKKYKKEGTATLGGLFPLCMWGYVLGLVLALHSQNALPPSPSAKPLNSDNAEYPFLLFSMMRG